MASRMYLMDEQKAQYVTFEIYPEHYGYPDPEDLDLIINSDSTGDLEYVMEHVKSEWVNSIEYKYLIDSLYADHMPTAWILHDQDILDNGTRKKPHIHVVKLGRGGITGKRWREDLSDLLENNYLEKVGDIKGMIRYLSHIDYPSKHQYPVSYIQTYNLSLLDYYYTDMDWLGIDDDIIDSIKTFNFRSLMDLRNAYKDNPTYLRRIYNRVHLFKAFLNSK